MDQYAKKENYVTAYPDTQIWKNHANHHIQNFYSHLLKGSVADLGANHGACTLLLLENDKIEEIYGVDMNYEALQVAYKLANDSNPKIPVVFIGASLLNIPIENEKFDAITSFHTLEHIYPDDAQTFLKEAHRILKPDGIFVISIPYDRAYPDVAHVAFYNVDSLCALFESNGFETIECLKDNRWNEKNLLTGLFKKRLKIQE